MFHGRSLTSPSVFDLLVLVIAPPLLVSVLLLLLLSLSRILQVGVGDGAGIIGVLKDPRTPAPPSVIHIPSVPTGDRTEPIQAMPTIDMTTFMITRRAEAVTHV